MASTYSTNLALELIGTGDQAGTWGNTTNTNLGTLIEQAISGYVTQAVSTGTDTTITIPNGSTGVARNMYIELTGTGGTNTNLIVPANKKLYFIFNNTSSGQVTVKVSGQTGVSVPNKAKMILVSNGTDIVDATNYIGNISAASANITTLTSASATITNLLATSLTVSGNTFLATSSGNVGIGTSSPSYKLDVNGQARLGGTAGLFVGIGTAFSSGQAEAYTTSTTPMGIGTAGAAPLRFYTNSNFNAVLDSSGNLGIGTSNPPYQLTILRRTGSTITAPLLNLQSQTSGSVDGDSFILFGTQAANWSAGVDQADSNKFRIEPSNTLGGADGLTITTAGNLGIGTTSPAYKLDVAGNINAGVTVGVNNSSSGASAISRFIAIGDAGNAVFGMTSSAYTDITGAADSMLLNASSASGGISFALDGVLRMKLDSSGNLGLGVTPSAWGVGYKAFQTDYLNFASATAGTGDGSITWNAYNNGTNWIYQYTGGVSTRYRQNESGHAWFYAASGTAGNAITFTQAMTLDASGQLLLGTTTSGTYKLDIVASNAFRATSGSTSAALFISAGTPFFGSSTNHPFVFMTNETERARITSGGFFKASNSGTYNNSTSSNHELYSNSSNNVAVVISHTGTSGQQYGALIQTTNDQDDATRYFLSCTGGATERATIRSNGGLANYSANNVNLASDERLKKDISPLASAWNKVKGMEVVNFRYKNCNEGDPLLYGVIAQQVQPIVPELVVVTREATETDPEYYGIREQPMYWLAIKALQEAMTKIEKLEAEVAALKGT